MNLGIGSGDAPDAVRANRERLAAAIGATPVFLRQVHGARVVSLDAHSAHAGVEAADAAWTSEPGVACTVLVSDCLPVLLAAPQARAVGAAHAGWRGLSAGVVEHCARAVCDAASCEPHELVVWLGPCIGPDAFEVGADVLMAFGVDPRPDERRSAFAISLVPTAIRVGAPTSRVWHAIGSLRSACGASAAAPGARCKTAHGSSRFVAMASPDAWPPRSGCVADARRARRRRDPISTMESASASGASPSTSVTSAPSHGAVVRRRLRERERSDDEYPSHGNDQHFVMWIAILRNGRVVNLR